MGICRTTCLSRRHRTAIIGSRSLVCWYSSWLLSLIHGLLQLLKLLLKDKISEHLPKDQERAATLGVPLKILAHPNDAIGKVYGVEHSGRVRGVGGSICPSAAFGMPRHSISHANIDSSSNMSYQRVEDLEKHIETLKEKLTRYEETKEKLEDTKEKLEETKKQLVQNELT